MDTGTVKISTLLLIARRHDKHQRASVFRGLRCIRRWAEGSLPWQGAHLLSNSAARMGREYFSINTFSHGFTGALPFLSLNFCQADSPHRSLAMPTTWTLGYCSCRSRGHIANALPPGPTRLKVRVVPSFLSTLSLEVLRPADGKG